MSKTSPQAVRARHGCRTPGRPVSAEGEGSGGREPHGPEHDSVGTGEPCGAWDRTSVVGG